MYVCDPELQVCLGGVFEDPGVVVSDNIDPSSFLQEDVVTSVLILGEPTNLVQAVTIAFPFSILYDVSDSAGNAAVTKTRFVQVISQAC